MKTNFAKTNFAIAAVAAAFTSSANASATDAPNAMAYHMAASNAVGASIRSDDSTPITDREHAERAFLELARLKTDPLINPGNGNYSSGGNIDDENDPGPQRDDRNPAGPERDPNDGGHTDNGFGRDPRPEPKPEVNMRTVDVINFRPDLLNVQSILNSGSRIGG